MSVLRALLVFVLLTPVASAAELKTLKGASLKGEVVSISDKEVVLEVDGKKVSTPIPQILQLNLKDGFDKIESDAKYAEVELTDGTLLKCSKVELIESDARKCAFLREAARIAGAAVTVRHARIEAVPSYAVDVVTARACAPLERLLVMAQRFIAPHTVCLFLKGERAAEELTAARRGWTMRAACHPSRADPRGVILKLEQITREPQGGG